MTQTVLITRKIPEIAVKILKEQGVIVKENLLDRALTREELEEMAKDVQGIITMLSDVIDDDFLKKCPSLKVISNYAVGHNNIDSQSAKKRGVAVGNTPDVLTNATAELALALMLASARNFKSASAHVQNGEWKSWSPLGHLGQELSSQTVAIIGAGRIGQRLGEMVALGLGMKVLYCSNNPKKEFEMKTGAKKVDFEQALATADFVSVHCPLTSSTKNLFNANAFSLMKKDSIFINTARGEIHDEKALIQALKTNHLFAAGLDVTNPEPIKADSELLTLENALIIPHIGSATFKARENMAKICAQNILLGLKGQNLHSSVY